MAEVLSTVEPGENLSDEHKAIYKIFNREYNSSAYRDRRKNMDRWLEQFEAELWQVDDLDEEDSRVQVNFIFSNIAALAPLLTDNKPIWNVLARDPQFQKLANIYSKALGWLWDAQRWDEIVAEVANDFLLWPVGLTKTYWDPEEEEVMVDVVDPRTFVIAPGYDDIWKAPWCGERTVLPMSWVAMNYPDKIDEVKPEKGDEQRGANASNKSSFELETEEVTVYEIWYRDSTIIDYVTEEKDGDGKPIEKKEKRKKYPNGRLITMTRDVVLDDRESPFDHGKPPYVAWYDYKVPHKFWGMGEPQQIESLHIEYNKQLQNAVKHSRHVEDPNYTADTSTNMDMDLVKDTISGGGNIYEFNGAANGNQQPIRVIEMGQLDRVVPMLLEVLPAAIEETSGITALSKGQAEKKERQSASEVSIIIESSYTRVRQKVRNFEASIKRNCELAISLMQQNYIEPRYFSYKKGTEDGDALNYMLLSNTPEYYKEISTPEQAEYEHPRTGKSVQEKDKDYEKRLETDEEYQGALRLMKNLGTEGKINFKFQVTIETNSTLPQDKQTLVNTLLRLAEIRVGPDSIVDDVAVIGPGGLNIPNHQAIIARKQKEKERIMAMQSGGQPPAQGQPQQQMQGPRPVPLPRNPAEQAQPAPETA